jgi:hypothetical protein
MLNIIDDFIKPRLQDEIENVLLNGNFPYYYLKESVNKNECGFGDTMEDDNTLEIPQFYHMVVTDGRVNSEHHTVVSSVSSKLIDIVDVDCFISRCKINLNTMDTRFKDKYHTPHIDNAYEEQITAIYYVNDSDGDTIFFDNAGNITDRITPKKGRLVWWKGRVFHAKSSPVETTQRVVINFNLLPHRDNK